MRETDKANPCSDKVAPIRNPECPEISVVLPVYRNADILHNLYLRLRRVLEHQGLSFELLFVDDACPAGSLTVLKELAKEDGRVGVLALKRNVGQHRAIMTGLAHARGKFSIIMDADLQDPPEAIPMLLAKAKEGFAVVFAGRRGEYESPFRLFTSRIFKRLLNIFCGVPLDAGIYVVLNRKMVARLLAYDEPRPFVVAMIGCARMLMFSIPIEKAQRSTGESGYSFWKRLKTGCLALAWVIFYKLRSKIIQPKDQPIKQYSGKIVVKAYVGSRFDHAADENSNKA